MSRFLKITLVLVLMFALVLPQARAAGRGVAGGRQVSAPLPLANGYWTSYYDAPGWAQVYGVACLEDDSIVAVGYTSTSPSASQDIWVRKYNPDGSTAWTRTYDSGHGNDVAYGVSVYLQDIMVVGTVSRSATDSDAWMRRYGPDGSVAATVVYRGVSTGRNEAYACKVYGNYGSVVVGMSDSGGNRRAWVRKMYQDWSGASWTKMFSSGTDSAAFAVSCDVNGNPAATGVSGGRAWMRKYEESTGSSLWNKTVTTGNASGGWGIAYGPDDNFAICGLQQDGSDTNAWVKLIRNSNGSDVWTKSFSGSGYQAAWGVARDPLGNCIVTGQNDASGMPRSWARKYTPQGGTAWTETYSGSPGIAAIPYGVACDSDGNSVIGGARVFSARNGAFVRKYPPWANANPEWFLAEGTTAWGFDTYIGIENPNTSQVHATVTYMTSGGPVNGGTITMPPMSRATVDPRAVLGDKDFSTRVVCTEGMTIAVDRTMSWTGTGAGSPEGHSSIGVTMPGTRWYLPEGSTQWGFECFLLIQNPNPVRAWVSVHYMYDGGGDYVVNSVVDPNSRYTIDCSQQIPGKDASIEVISQVPVIPERAMYRNARREGHDSIGTRKTSTSYFLAEGTTSWGFTTFVLVENPHSEENQVTITYMTPSGPRAQAPFAMPGYSRRTIRVNDALPGTDFSTQVQGTLPLIAERAMYWSGPTGEACHDSIGLDSAHQAFYLPDGQTSEGRETWTLVQNANAGAVDVKVTYLSPDGTANQSFTDSIPPQSRKTYNMADRMPSTMAAILVECLTPGAKIMCERAMYWNGRGAGTGTIGGFSD